MSYSVEDADSFWSRRVGETDDLAAVLYYGMPKSFNQVYSDWEISCLFKTLGEVKGKRVLDL